MDRTFNTHEGIVTYSPYTQQDIEGKKQQNGKEYAFPLIYGKPGVYEIIGTTDSAVKVENAYTRVMSEISYQELLDNFLFWGFDTICGKKTKEQK